jgi:hypothetical protein
MSLTQIAVVLVGAWMILSTQLSSWSNTATTVVGIVVILLVVLDGRAVLSRR